MKKKSPLISIVTPVYKCKECLYPLYRRLSETMGHIGVDYEIIMVNDGCPDNSWEVIEHLAQEYSVVRGINLSRNFGQHYAITAGLDYARGEWIVVMDCDLQDRPEEIANLYRKAQEGYDVVFGRRSERKDSLVKKFASVLFYKAFGYFTDSKFDPTVANFSICHKKVIENVKKLKERYRLFPLLVYWTGFDIGFVNIEHAKREQGKSAYTWRKLFDLGVDLIIAHSNKPLKLSIKLGFSISLISFLLAIYFTLRYFILKIPVQGWTSLIVSLYFIAGILLADIGILGLYIGKTFDETKNRPLYIVKETTKGAEND